MVAIGARMRPSMLELMDAASVNAVEDYKPMGLDRTAGALLIAHEDNLTGGFGGEIAAIVAEHAFEHLDAPVRRVAAIDTPIPFAPALEREYLPLEDDILAAARQLAEY